MVAQGMDPQHVEFEGCDVRPIGEPAPEIELVDHVPAVDVGTDPGQEKGKIALKKTAVVGFAEAPQPVEPQGVGEVMQGDKDLDALLREIFQKIKVVGQGLVVPLTLRGLDSAPLDRHAITLVAKGCEQFHILPIEAVVVAGLTRRSTDCAFGVVDVKVRLLLCVPCLGVGVVAFNLMPGSGAAPYKALWKADGWQAEDIIHEDTPGLYQHAQGRCRPDGKKKRYL